MDGVVGQVGLDAAAVAVAVVPVSLEHVYLFFPD
jgi:hypothetical protein